MADENNPNNATKDDGMTRRDFIKNGSMVAGGVVGGTFLGGLLGRQFWGTQDTAQETDTQTDDDQAHDHAPANDYTEARMFFKRQEDFRVLSAAVERIFPEDDLGPGAITLGVPYYIDKQLAGSYGRNAREYMQGPFAEGAVTQGFQSGMYRQDIFLQGIRRMQSISRNNFNEAFFDLEEEHQINILIEFEEGNVDMNGIRSAEFFNMLRTVTLEGVYADPVYGGNRNMDGWRLKQYPGGQMAYIDMIEEDDFVEMEPVSLHDHHS